MPVFAQRIGCRVCFFDSQDPSFGDAKASLDHKSSKRRGIKIANFVHRLFGKSTTIRLGNTIYRVNTKSLKKYYARIDPLKDCSPTLKSKLAPKIQALVTPSQPTNVTLTKPEIVGRSLFEKVHVYGALTATDLSRSVSSIEKEINMLSSLRGNFSQLSALSEDYAEISKGNEPLQEAMQKYEQARIEKESTSEDLVEVENEKPGLFSKLKSGCKKFAGKVRDIASPHIEAIPEELKDPAKLKKYVHAQKRKHLLEAAYRNRGTICQEAGRAIEQAVFTSSLSKSKSKPARKGLGSAFLGKALSATSTVAGAVLSIGAQAVADHGLEVASGALKVRQQVKKVKKSATETFKSDKPSSKPSRAKSAEREYDQKRSESVIKMQRAKIELIRAKDKLALEVKAHESFLKGRQQEIGALIEVQQALAAAAA